MILCVDTGGTKTLVAEFASGGPTAPDPIRVHRFPTPQSSDEYIRKLSTLITQEYNLLEIEAITVAVPGEIIHGKLAWCGNLPWTDFDVVGQLAAALRFVKPIYLDNDANMAALGEAHAIKPLPASVLYLTVSTGVNGCLISDGDIEPALSKSEMGMMVVEYKGQVVTWESIASGRALFKKYGQYARDITDPAIWHEVADTIARGLLDIIPILQPDVIVIGGSVGSYFDRFAEPLRDIVDTELYAHLARPRIQQARHPEEAVIYGGYVYATRTHVAR